MTRTIFLSALTAAALIASAAGSVSVNAADLSLSHRTYNANRDGTYNDDKPAPRQFDRDYDEDDSNFERRRHRGDGWGRHHDLRRVEARASYVSDYLPYYVREWRAKSSAIDAWKSKVSHLYGERFAHWRMATGQQVSCDAAAGSVYCTVSARPARGGSRWSWNRDYRLQ